MKAVKALIVVVFLGVAGCASIINKADQTVTINSTPDDAVISMNGLSIGRTPWTGPVKRQSDMVIEVKKEGYDQQLLNLKGEMSAWVLGNVLGGLIFGPPSTTTDYAGGSAYMYDPAAYHVSLVPHNGGEGAVRQNQAASRLKRFVLAYYSELAAEIQISGKEEKITALMQLMGHSDLGQFKELFRKEFVEAANPDALAERLIALSKSESSTLPVSDKTSASTIIPASGTTAEPQKEPPDISGSGKTLSNSP